VSLLGGELETALAIYEHPEPFALLTAHPERF
jgi:hypothetical protein